jgi:hypothetical protein
LIVILVLMRNLKPVFAARDSHGDRLTRAVDAQALPWPEANAAGLFLAIVCQTE